uniref:Prenyl transferase n=1 Tax=Spyridia filamentosa TaxID=196632 RepID=A0A1Z1MK74_SPYFI|nr:prenyl transferase [Spyridia filamentosa]ARW66225.1 prenyl transferase [Spyridia filamentosa]
MTLSNNIFYPVQEDLIKLNNNLNKMIAAKHPILYAASEHLFQAGGKRIRPTIVFLVSQSTMKNQAILPEHRRLAEITEIIHTASLLHDDVIDDCPTRRGINSVHSKFNTKIAVLAGDFLFAQSSWYLANLNNLEAVKTISKVIIDFAEGEVKQGLINFDTTVSIEEYISKSFYKTASLIAASCKGAAILSKCDKKTQNLFYEYGKHIGLAFQIVDDILDVTTSPNILGKPSGSDFKNGNLTAPLIFALEEYPELQILINREFQNKNDISNTVKIIIQETKAIQKSKDLAQEYIQNARKIINEINCNITKRKLLPISNYIIDRIK